MEHSAIERFGPECPRRSSSRAEGNGYFSGLVAGAGDGSLYRYRLDGDDLSRPGLAVPAEGPARPVPGDRSRALSPGTTEAGRG